MERQPSQTSGEHDERVPTPRSRLAEEHVATGLVLQKRKIRHLPNNDHPQPLHVALQGQDHSLYGQVRKKLQLNFNVFFCACLQINIAPLLRHELYDLPPRHAGMQIANGVL